MIWKIEWIDGMLEFKCLWLWLKDRGKKGGYYFSLTSSQGDTMLDKEMISFI